jgi:CRISPR/Cas system-associated exonuclease Cas4 (RecB family)
MRIELVSPKNDLVATIASRLRADGKDYSRRWVVFPEKRPAYYLRKKLAERERSGFVPPRIDAIDAFVDRISAERLGLRGRPIDTLDAVALLFEIHRDTPGRPGGDRFVSADHFFPLGVKLFHDLEELHAAGVGKDDLAKLDHWADETVPEAAAKRLQSMSLLHERFYGALEARGFSTPSTRYRDVAALVRPELFTDIDEFIFAGFFSLTKTEADLLKAMLAWDKSSLYLLKGKGIETLLDKLGVADLALRKEIETPEPDPPLEFVRSADTHGQIFALNKILEGPLRDPRLFNEKQVIVLPAAEALFPLYQQTLSALSEENFNISLGYPLSRTPIFSFFSKLFELIQSKDEEGRIYIPNYLRFVLHPYTKNIYFPGPDKRTDLTRILFHAVEEELTRRRTRAFWSLDELEGDAEIRAAVQERVRNVENAPVIADFVEHWHAIHEHTLSLFNEIRNVGDFADKLIRVLNYIYENSTARLHYFFHPYAEAFLARLDALARSLLRETVFDDPASYFNLLRKVIAAGTVPFYGTPLRGLQVLGFWETRGISFEHVYILDMNEDTIPSFTRADSLLPFAARAALGLPTYQDLERRMEYYLDTLVKAAGTVHFFFVENDDKEKSRFVEKLIWERQKRERDPRSDKYVKTVRYRLALQAGEPNPVAKTSAVAEYLREFAFSATSLDMYLKCPVRFYYAYVLKLKEKEEMAEPMDKKDIGTFVHAILEEYFKKWTGRRIRAEDLDPNGLDAIVERRFSEEYGRDPAGSAYLMKLQVKRHLREFILDYQIPVIRTVEEKGGELRIQTLEQRLHVERSVGGTSFKLAAKVDRIERRGEELYILDYKTSASEKYAGINFNKLVLAERPTWKPSVASLQLPLYNMICSRTLQIPAERIHGVLLILGRNRLSPKIEYSPYEENDLDKRKEQIRTMEALVDKLLAEIVDPRHPFDPAPAAEGTCEGCPFAYICNRQ